MDNNKELQYEVIIIGGSYAGLQAGMTLGRSLRRTLIIDDGKPCNRQTPHSHNMLTQDGARPADISAIGKEQVMKYPSVSFAATRAIKAVQIDKGFRIETEDGNTYTCRRLLLATGVHDITTDIPGLSVCWGISVLHCPYCHGYEVKGLPTGVISNGPFAEDYLKMIHHWTDKLTLFTNGTPELSEEGMAFAKSRNIELVAQPIKSIVHQDGYIKEIVLKDGSARRLTACYYRPTFVQHSDIAETLGCEMNEHGLVNATEFGQTNIPGLFVAGDNSNMMRSVAASIANGMKAAAWMNRELIMEDAV